MTQHSEASILARKASEDEALLDKTLSDLGISDSIWGFHAQQAIEKLMKAALMHSGIAYPKTHDLGLLHQLGMAGKLEIPFSESDLAEFGPLAVDFRYDDSSDSPLDRKAIRTFVNRVRAWVDGILSKSVAG